MKLLTAIPFLILTLSPIGNATPNVEGVFRGACLMQGSKAYSALTFFIFKDNFGSFEQDFCSDVACADAAFVAGFTASGLTATGEQMISLNLKAPHTLVITPLIPSAVALLDKEFLALYNVTAKFAVATPTTFRVPKDLGILRKQIDLRIIDANTIELGNVTSYLANGSEQVFSQLSGCRLST